MPIINIQRRMAEQGRIRLGQKVATTKRNGEPGTRPEKLDRFRFTSANRSLIEQIAARYGGTPAPWDNAGKSEYEVVTDARSIPVIVVKGGFSQWHELWSKAGCLHRCDGEKDVEGTFCDPDDPQHIAAIEKPTTRLSVMLSEIETLGVWRMESKGWNAAAELPSMAELAMHVGDLVPATLSLVERSSIIDGPKGPTTSRFVVPVLDLAVSKARLMAIMSREVGPVAVAAPAQREAIGSGSAPAMDLDDWTDAVADATTEVELKALWDQANEAGAPPQVAEWIRARVAEIRAEQVAAGPVPAAQDPRSDVDDAWFVVTGEAGRQGMKDAEVRADFEAFAGHGVDAATAEELGGYLEHLRAVPAGAAS